MRKSSVLVIGMVLLVVAVASALAKSGGPRLDGSFKVTETIGVNDVGLPAGTVSTDTYVFKSLCGKGACAKVTLTRKSGGRNVRSTLRKISPGVYEGTESPQPYTCVRPLGDKGQFSGTNKITVTRKSKDGLAKEFTGRLSVQITGCTEEIEEASLKGKLTQ
jgi:hypothetical protein